MLVCLAFIFYHLLTFIRYTEENVSFALWIVFVTLLNLGSALYNTRFQQKFIRSGLLTIPRYNISRAFVIQRCWI